MNMTEEQFEKLPRYAQDEIKILRRRVEDAEASLRDLLGPATPAVGFIHPSSSRFRAPHPIMFGPYDTVRIAVTGELGADGLTQDSSQEFIDINRTLEGRIRIRAGWNSLAVLPASANTVEVTTASQLTDEGRMSS